MKNNENNYAFIDGQNLNLGIREMGWQLDYFRFRVYLKDKYGVIKAFYFLGYLPENEGLYCTLRKYGYNLIFKPVIKDKNKKSKSNVDAELVLWSMITYFEYDKAVIITSDGDFYCLINYLYNKDKLEKVISPNSSKCSILVAKSAKEKIIFMDNLKFKFKYK